MATWVYLPPADGLCKAWPQGCLKGVFQEMGKLLRLLFLTNKVSLCRIRERCRLVITGQIRYE